MCLQTKQGDLFACHYAGQIYPDPGGTAKVEFNVPYAHMEARCFCPWTGASADLHGLFQPHNGQTKCPHWNYAQIIMVSGRLI